MADYNKYSVLKDYALWYYFRYFPSNKKLENKLFEKSWNTELVSKVFLDISHLLNEDDIIKSKIDNYIFRNKNLNYIKNKLLEKLFPKEKIEIILREKLDLDRSLLNGESLKRKIQNYKDRNKSINYIKQKLIERMEDRELVESCLEDVFWKESDLASLKNEYEKIKDLDTKKLVEKLLRKGFKYSDIKKLIN